MRIPDELELELRIKGFTNIPLGMIETYNGVGYEWDGKNYLFLVHDDTRQLPHSFYYLSDWSDDGTLVLQFTVRKTDPNVVDWFVEKMAMVVRRQNNPSFWDIYDEDGVYLAIERWYKVKYFLRRLKWRIKSILA